MAHSLGVQTIVNQAEAAYGLSGAQCVIAGHIVSGRSLKQIAHVLGRHRRTVEDHVAKLKRKTGSRTMVELVARLGAAGPNGQAREDAERLVREFAKRHDLTGVQATVFMLLVGGSTIRDVARILERHPNTVKEHLAVVRRKAGACTCLDLAATLRPNGPTRQERAR